MELGTAAVVLYCSWVINNKKSKPIAEQHRKKNGAEKYFQGYNAKSKRPLEKHTKHTRKIMKTNGIGICIDYNVSKTKIKYLMCGT